MCFCSPGGSNLDRRFVTKPTSVAHFLSGVDIITNIISGLAFRFNKESNDRLDNTTRELSIVDRATVAMHYISYISDKDKRDEAIQELIAYLYQVTSNQNASKSEQEKKQ